MLYTTYYGIFSVYVVPWGSNKAGLVGSATEERRAVAAALAGGPRHDADGQRLGNEI